MSIYKIQQFTWKNIQFIDRIKLILYPKVINSRTHLTLTCTNKGMAFNTKMEYQVFLCIFQKNSVMATLGWKKMGKFLWEGREKVLRCWLSQFSKTKLRQPTGQNFFPTNPIALFISTRILKYLV